MNSLIQVKSMFDGRSHHGSFRQHLWHRWRWWLIVRRFVCVGLMAVGAYMAVKTYGRGDRFSDFITISFILLGSVGYMRPMIWQMWNERKLRRHPAYQTKIHYTFSSDRVDMDGSSGKVSVPWGEFSEVVETKLGLLLYQNKKDYLWIPGYDFEGGDMAKVVLMHRFCVGA